MRQNRQFRLNLPFFRDQFAHCPWVRVSQDGEQCENGNLVKPALWALAAVLLVAALMALPHPLPCLPHLSLAARKTRKRTAMETTCVANEP